MSIIARIYLVAMCLLLTPAHLALAAEAGGSCSRHVAQWLDPASGQTLVSEQVFKRLENSRIVLLGEAHTTLAHHRWQHYMLSALHSRNANMIVGFEMLPRRAQAALDAWSAGNLSEKEFLVQSDWRKVWGYDAALYLPLLHFVRFNRLPAIALNIDRELVSRVGQQGWQALGNDQRMGLSDPAPASDDYRDALAEIYAYKQALRQESEGKEIDDSETDLSQVMSSEGFANFVDAQLTWDRAMAEALAAEYWRDPGAILVGIVGRGHLEYGYGVPHQLADMGIDDVDVLLPLDSNDDCDSLPAELASAVFVVDAEAEEPLPPRPRLGVFIESDDGGVRVVKVVAGSVADKTGLTKGDLIQSAAGFGIGTTRALVEIVQRQAPGTWLPLTVLRGDESLEYFARFPQSFE